MKIRVLGGYGSELPGCNLTGFLIDGRILLDAGTVTSVLTLEEQSAITHIIISHAHLDHVRGIPFLIDNVLGNGKPPVVLAGYGAVVDSISENILNGMVWPDFSKIPSASRPGIRYRKLAAGRGSKVGGLTVRPIQVCHSVPTTGFIITGGKSTIVYSGDTSETEKLWKAASKLERIDAVFIECSFPDSMAGIAARTRHLTPKTAMAEVAKIGGYDGPVYGYHVKSQFRKEVERDVKALGKKNFKTAKDGQVIEV